MILKTFMFSYEFLFLYKNLQSIIYCDIFYKYKKRIKINKYNLEINFLIEV